MKSSAEEDKYMYRICFFAPCGASGAFTCWAALSGTEFLVFLPP